MLLSSRSLPEDHNTNDDEDDAVIRTTIPVAPISSSTVSAKQQHHDNASSSSSSSNNHRRTSASSSSSVSEVDRAIELLGILIQELIVPIGKGLLVNNNRWFTWKDWTWEQFWEFELVEDNNITVAEQCTRCIERMGATYVKFGQALASRPDIVPRAFAIALSKLQDNMDVDCSYNEDDDTLLRLDTVEGARAILRQQWSRTNATTATTTTRTPFFDDDEELELFLYSLSKEPVAAASIGVVYSGIVPPKVGRPSQKVAIKIQRPNILQTVMKDAKLLQSVATWIEAIPISRPKSASSSSSTTMIKTDLTGAVEEFISRLYEELDYHREVKNIETFSKLYSHRRSRTRMRKKNKKKKNKKQAVLSSAGTSIDENDEDDETNHIFNNNHIRVVVPDVYPELCTEKVIVMEWIEGTKLIDLQRNRRQTQLQYREESNPNNSVSDDTPPLLTTVDRVQKMKQMDQETLELINQGIDCTLSQLLETGVMHADPHGGNLMKVPVSNTKDGESSSSYLLGYIDFGVLSKIPTQVQDGLICAVCQLIFAKNVTAVGELFNELMLLPKEVVNDPNEMDALAAELEFALENILVFDTVTYNDVDGPIIPMLKFDKLLDVLTRLVPRFSFQLPPYFLNNARALATLEGTAREVDPQFNILHNLYPYAISRLFSNPTNSDVVTKCLKSLTESPKTGQLDVNKILQLLQDASYYSGYQKRKVVKDLIESKNGFKIFRRLLREQITTSPSLLLLLKKKSKTRGEMDEIMTRLSQQKNKERLLPLRILDQTSDLLRL